MSPPPEDWLLPAVLTSSGSEVVQVEHTFGDEGDPYPRAGTTSAAAVGSANMGSAKPVATVAQLADYLVNGFWQYNATIAHHWSASTITYNIEGLNSGEQFLAQSALQAWHDAANINFARTSGGANIAFNHNGSMQAYTDANWDGSGAITSATVDISSDWVTTDGGARDGKTGIDSYAYQTYIHELGHALGLGHQGPYNGSATYSTDATYANDTWQYSIMSYFAQDNYDSSSYRYVVTPQMADIYAVAGIYGAASTRTGNTVYGFNSNAGTIFDFTKYAQAPALTIYDSGGNDTLDCSGYSAAQTIDLHAGAFSSVGGFVHNIGIAANTTIENAIGGSGNDTLIANDLGCTLTGGAGNDTLVGGAGNDRLIGGPGIDTMTGGGGADTFVFMAGDSSIVGGQHDRITDFTPGVDHIDLSAIDAISATAAHDSFHFIGLSGFNGGAGELDYFFNSALGVTVLQGDTNGDRNADFAIDLTGNITLSINDLIGAVAGWSAAQVVNIHANDLNCASTASGSNHFIDLVNFEASFRDLASAFGLDQGAMQSWYDQRQPLEGRVESFDGLEYVASYPDLVAAFGKMGSVKTVQDAGATHFIQAGMSENRSTTFNGLDYIASYRDLIRAFGADADAGAFHFIEQGFNEHRATSFDGLNYIASYPDLIHAFGANEQAGAAHFINQGATEQRTTTFDGLAYIAQNPDLMLTFGANSDAGATHYITTGINEHRSTSFDVAGYEQAHPDLVGAYATNDQFLAAYINYFVVTGHYLT